MTDKTEKETLQDDETTEFKLKNRKRNAAELKDANTHYENIKEYAENYASYSKIREMESIASYMKKKGYLNGGSSEADSSEDSGEGGSGNGKLFGAADYKGPDSTATGNPWSGGPHFTTGVKAKLVVCDKQDDAILKACTEEKVDPMLMKIMMLLESGGNPNTGASSDGAGSLGIMQITPGNYGVDMDASKLSDPYYSFTIAAKGFHGKANVAKSVGKPTSVKNVSHYYNGDGPNAAMYANAFAEIYEGFPGLKSSNDYRTMSGIKEESKTSSGGGSTNATGNMKKVIEEAKKYLGVPYIWGGKTPSPGWDCSGFTGWAFAKGMGKDISTYTVTQEPHGSPVSNSDIKMGDLLFWGSVGASYHVALHIGNGEYIHAPKPGDITRIAKMTDWPPDFARRPSY